MEQNIKTGQYVFIVCFFLLWLTDKKKGNCKLKLDTHYLSSLWDIIQVVFNLIVSTCRYTVTLTTHLSIQYLKTDDDKWIYFHHFILYLWILNKAESFANISFICQCCQCWKHVFCSGWEGQKLWCAATAQISFTENGSPGGHRRNTPAHSSQFNLSHYNVPAIYIYNIYNFKMYYFDWGIDLWIILLDPIIQLNYAINHQFC